MAFIPFDDVALFPNLYNTAAQIANLGHDTVFISEGRPSSMGDAVGVKAVEWRRVELPTGVASRIPVLRGAHTSIFRHLCSAHPHVIVAEQAYVLPAMLYKMLARQNVKIIGYYADYWPDAWYAKITGSLSFLLDAYVDVCDIRLQWRKKNWPGMRGDYFITRQAPHRRRSEKHEDHRGAVRIVFASSGYVLGLERERLSRFLERLCCHGMAVDWYLPGSDEVRLAAKALTSHDLFRVLEPVEKSRLPEVLGQYDVGLHWAPMAERAYDPYYFDSTASNKIGEYIAAGLVVGHAGNPGLSYLPADVCAIFDPTDPEAGADQLASALADRGDVERKRKAALGYHLGEMNFEAQAEPFIRYITQPA
ncbi:hypothetical protein [Brevundimonas sp. KM4]|uniref:hypothetical protein n=1 Tax=Brevundimonas sp. KM4 TaxID=1628191 RepID=UPI0012E09A75|nr:hypothetical protein [Brevundimonas sp. KM4]